MHEFLIFLTYVVEGLAVAAGGFVLLLMARPRPEDTTTYWIDGQAVSRREYELLRDRMAAARRRGNPPA